MKLLAWEREGLEGGAKTKLWREGGRRDRGEEEKEKCERGKKGTHFFV
jgi:hypothetical protein